MEITSFLVTFHNVAIASFADPPRPICAPRFVPRKERAKCPTELLGEASGGNGGGGEERVIVFISWTLTRGGGHVGTFRYGRFTWI